MQEKDIKVWKIKIDWIAKKGGMVLVNVHPDYINFNNENTAEEFPVELYINLLEHIKDNYSGIYWHSLPKEIAQHVFNQHDKVIVQSKILIDN